MPSEARQKKIMEKLNRAQKTFNFVASNPRIKGGQALGPPGSGPVADSRVCHWCFSHASNRWIEYLIPVFTPLWISFCCWGILQWSNYLAAASSGSSDWVRGARNMKSMRPPSAAIFFMTYFYRARGGHGPLAPPGSATAELVCLTPKTKTL